MSIVLCTATLLASATLSQAQSVSVQLFKVVEMRKTAYVVDPAQRSFDPAGEPRLVITVDMHGPLAMRAYRYGFIDTLCIASDGTELKPLGQGQAHAHPIDSFVNIDRDMMFAWDNDKPLDKVRIEMGFEPPARAARDVSLSGTITLLAADNQREVTFKDVRALGNTALTHEALTAAGIRINLQPNPSDAMSLRDPARSIALDITGPIETITAMELVDAQGNELSIMRMWQSVGSQTSYTLQGFETLPDTVHLKLTVAVGQRRVAVPFEFKKVVLP